MAGKAEIWCWFLLGLNKLVNKHPSSRWFFWYPVMPQWNGKPVTLSAYVLICYTWGGRCGDPRRSQRDCLSVPVSSSIEWRHNGFDGISNHQPHDCLLVYSGKDQRKHQSSAPLAFVRGIHRWPRNSPHIWPATRKRFPFDDVIRISLYNDVNANNA